MEYGLLIDISCCGSDCFDQLNNPINSVFRIVDETLETKKEFVRYIVPEEEITASAWSLHRLSKADINDMEDKMDLIEYLKESYSILKKCREKGLYLIGFNHASFDLGILNRHFVNKCGLEPITWPGDKVIDIVQLCTKSSNFRDVGNYTLDACVAHFCGDDRSFVESLINKSHNAVNDSETEITLMKIIMEKNSMKSFGEIRSFLEKLPEFTEFSWGKYKGLSVDKVYQIDKQYLTWCMRNSDVRTRHPNLIEKIKDLYSRV